MYFETLKITSKNFFFLKALSHSFKKKKKSRIYIVKFRNTLTDLEPVWLNL